MSLNRGKFLNAVADRSKSHRRDVEHVWEHAVAVIADAVRKGEDVSIKGFGKFKQRVTKARAAGMRKDPFTGEMRHFPARPAKKAPKFLPAKQLREFVGGAMRAFPTANTKPKALAGAPTAPKAAAKKKAAPKKTVKKKAAPKRKAAKRRR